MAVADAKIPDQATEKFLIGASKNAPHDADFS
jgi:hypothetical protein